MAESTATTLALIALAAAVVALGLAVWAFLARRGPAADDSSANQASRARAAGASSRRPGDDMDALGDRVDQLAEDVRQLRYLMTNLQVMAREAKEEAASAVASAAAGAAAARSGAARPEADAATGGGWGQPHAGAHATWSPPPVTQPLAQPPAQPAAYGAYGASYGAPEPAAAASGGEPAAAGDLTPEAAQRVFTAWCRDHRFPEGDGSVERSALRVASADPANQGLTPRVLEDSRQVAEFARLGRAGAAEAYLFPNPESRFTPLVPKLFPALGADWDQAPATYERIAPLRIRRRADSRWETV